MDRRLEEKSEFEREYFTKTFKGFFVNKVAQLV